MEGVQSPHSGSATLVIDPLQFLLKHQGESDVARRLRASIYRMARKSAYLPHALQIEHSSISNGRGFGAGAHGIVTRAKMQGKDVVIKKILCNDRAIQRKCLEVWNLSSGISSL